MTTKESDTSAISLSLVMYVAHRRPCMRDTCGWCRQQQPTAKYVTRCARAHFRHDATRLSFFGFLATSAVRLSGATCRNSGRSRRRSHVGICVHPYVSDTQVAYRTKLAQSPQRQPAQNTRHSLQLLSACPSPRFWTVVAEYSSTTKKIGITRMHEVELNRRCRGGTKNRSKHTHGDTVRPRLEYRPPHFVHTASGTSNSRKKVLPFFRTQRGDKLDE